MTRRLALPTVRVVCLWFLLGIPCLGPIWAQSSAQDPAQWVAADAIAFLELNATDRILDHAYSPEVKALAEAIPGLKKQLKEKSPRELQLAAEYVARSVGMSATRLARELTAGGITASFEAPDQFLVVVKARDADILRKAHDTLLELARQDARQKKKPDPVKTTDHEEITIYQLGDQEAHILLDNALVLSNKPALVKRVIDRVKGKNAELATLADNPAWKARKAARAGDSAGWAFARLDLVRKLDPKFMKGKPQDEPGAKFLLGPWFETLQKAEWASFDLVADADRLSLELAMPQPESATQGPLAKYRPAAGQSAAPLVNPPGTLLSASLWRDFSAVWEVRNQFLPPEALQGFAQLDSFAGQFFGGRDFGTGVLGALGADWRVVVIQQDYEHMQPAPDVKFPGVALLLPLKPEDEEFPVRLKAAFQSFVGLVNLGQAQQKAPPLMLGSEVFEGVEISKGSYLPPSAAEAGKPIDPRYNLSPCAAQVNDTFILASSVDAAHAVIRALKSPAAAKIPVDNYTLLAQANGAEAAKLVELNTQSLVTRNMLEKGNDKQAADAEITALAKALHHIENATISVRDSGPEMLVRLNVRLKK